MRIGDCGVRSERLVVSLVELQLIIPHSTFYSEFCRTIRIPHLNNFAFACYSPLKDRPVALIGRATDSKSVGWGFESLQAWGDFSLKGIRRERSKSLRWARATTTGGRPWAQWERRAPNPSRPVLLKRNPNSARVQGKEIVLNVLNTTLYFFCISSAFLFS